MAIKEKFISEWILRKKTKQVHSIFICTFWLEYLKGLQS